MGRKSINYSVIAVVVIVGLALAGGGFAAAADYERISAQAQGQGAQQGQRFDISIVIYEYSTADDQQGLVDAFNAGGQEGLFNALTKMKARGRIAITGTLGYDVNYIKEFKSPEGRKIRFVTDRPIRFGEVSAGTRSKDYNLSACEISLSPDQKKNTGALLPSMQMKVGEEDDEIELELFQNPWKLVNIVHYPPK